MKKMIFVPVAVAVALAGCATAYQSEGLSGGFTETQLDANVWRVSFQGNGYTRGERANDYATLRSAELTLANGYTHFAFAESKSGEQLTAITSPTTSNTSASAYRSGSSVYGTARTTTYGGNTTFISSPSSTNLVVMFKGKPDIGGVAYDASFVCNSLGKKYEIVCGAPRK